MKKILVTRKLLKENDERIKNLFDVKSYVNVSGNSLFILEYKFKIVVLSNPPLNKIEISLSDMECILIDLLSKYLNFFIVLEKLCSLLEPPISQY